MKSTMVDKFEWLDDYRADDFVVRQYRAHHKNRIDWEEGLAFIIYEGQRIISVKVPMIVDYCLSDKFIIEPSAKGLRVYGGCDGFILWIKWFYGLCPTNAKDFIRSIFTNSKMPVSGLSAYIKDKLLEEEEQQ